MKETSGDIDNAGTIGTLENEGGGHNRNNHKR